MKAVIDLNDIMNSGDMSTLSVLVTYKFTDHAKECTRKALNLFFMTLTALLW